MVWLIPYHYFCVFVVRRKYMKNNICGIYYIKNIVNNNMYIGQSINIKTRFSCHKSALNKNRHYNEKLQKDFNK